MGGVPPCLRAAGGSKACRRGQIIIDRGISLLMRLAGAPSAAFSKSFPYSPILRIDARPDRCNLGVAGGRTAPTPPGRAVWPRVRGNWARGLHFGRRTRRAFLLRFHWRGGVRPCLAMAPSP
jgi:hypothetical protein